MVVIIVAVTFEDLRAELRATASIWMPAFAGMTAWVAGGATKIVEV